MKKRILFLDRDGTLIHEPEDNYQVDSLEKLQFMPGVIHNLYQIATQLDYLLIMVTNQDGLGTSSYPESDFWPAHNKMMQIFERESIVFDNIHIDRTFKADQIDTRKPGIGMLKGYLTDEYDLANSYVIGDRHSDMLLAKNLGAKGILYGESTDTQDQIENLDILADVIVMETQSWTDIRSFLFSRQPRRARIVRQTTETQIAVEINLDGQGTTQSQTGIGFLDHMLDQVGKHGQLDLSVNVSGDLHIDEHHTIEDTAIALGQAFHNALGDKKGINRYGCFLLPMDESMAQISLDFSGRAYLHFSGNIPRERVGDFPVEMVEHFFYSFCEHAHCTLHIAVYGKNAHHMIEAIFKGFAKSVAIAKSIQSGSTTIPSTKGIL